MATLVDALGVLKSLGVYQTIFPFILVLAGMYALLEKFKPFGEMKSVNAIISFIIAFLFISVAQAVTFINTLLPLLTLFLLLVVLGMLVFAFVGVKGESITEALTTNPAGWLSLLLIFFFVIVAVISQVMPEASLIIQNPAAAEQLNVSLTEPGATPKEQAAAYMFLQTIRIALSPQIMGLAMMLLIFAVATYFITREKK